MAESPTAYDVLVGVIHDWPDTGCTQIASAKMLMDDLLDAIGTLPLADLAVFLRDAGYDVLGPMARGGHADTSALLVAAKEPVEDIDARIGER